MLEPSARKLARWVLRGGGPPGLLTRQKGTNRVSASMLTEIARVLHVDVRSFFDSIEAQDGKELVHDMKPESLRVTRETVSLTEAFLQIGDARLRRKILDLVRGVAGSNIISSDEHLQDAAE